MLENTKACLFDLDGTLVESMHIWKDIDIEFLGRFGYDLPPSLQREIEGRSFTETAHYFKGRFDIPLSIDEIMECWNQMAYQKYAEEIGFKRGAFEFVKALKQKGIYTAICTSNSRELVTAVGEHLGFLPYFDAVITSCEVGAGKPEPDIYLEAAKRVHTEPRHCLVFEDTLAGLTAGKRAGMRICAVEDSFTASLRLEKIALADYYIEDYDALLQAFEE